MKVLLDECMPRKLQSALAGHSRWPKRRVSIFS